MNNEKILNKIFDATCKLELMQTVIDALINIAQEIEVRTPEQAMIFASKKKMIEDFLHIAFEGVYEATEMLNCIQEEDTSHKKGGDVIWEK